MREKGTLVRPNEARPLFRVLSGGMGFVGWAVGGVAAFFAIKEQSWWLFWQVAFTSLAFGSIFSFVAIAGYMPRWIVRIFSRGPVPGEEDMR